VTGAVSTVDSKTLEILKPVKVEQTLQGTVSGVVTSRAIDAIVKRRKRTNNNYRVCWRIRFVKSNDIETITVLKDTSSNLRYYWC
jgi:hypothetical protein